MIAEAEIRRYAAQKDVDPMIVDLDYSLGWFLLGLIKAQTFVAHVRFKGGTCLRKCYFPDYRFSEDLDFTLSRPASSENLELWMDEAVAWITDHDGPDFRTEPLRMEVVNDEYGKFRAVAIQHITECSPRDCGICDEHCGLVNVEP